MSRKPRIEFNGAIYHVFQRGNNKEYIFRDDEEKGFFLKQIKEYMEPYGFKIFAYVIMDNHYHLILQAKEIPIHKIMHNINNVYSKFYNKRHDRTRHVFEERYSSKLVEEDAYLIWLLRYIHRNPVRAHMCKKTDEYSWSTDLFYRKNIRSLIDIDFIFNIFSDNRYNSIKIYLEIMNEPDQSKKEDFQYIKDKFQDSNILNKNYASIETEICIRKSLQEILNHLDLNEQDEIFIKSGSRKRYLTPYKIKFIKEAVEHKYTFEEIGKFIGISQSGISRILIDHSK